jgi:asparagine synthetase B (glutamine-hydrolysing)
MSAQRRGGAGLRAELDAELMRLGVRTLARDDRAVSDRGKEVRCPYLDDAVVAFLARLPGHVVADLGREPGCGDKRILRAAAVAVGLPSHGSARLVKRAIQFGSRIAKLTNRGLFGGTSRGDGAAPFAGISGSSISRVGGADED